MFAYIGREGYLADLELREGKQHSQKGTPEFLKETIGICRQLTDEPLLFRLDSGNDSAENIGILMESGCHFIIKHNLHRESKEDWLKMAEENSIDISHPWDGKTVYIGSDWKEITYRTEDGTEKQATIRMGHEITERTMDRNGQFLLVPDIEVNTWWTNTDFMEACRSCHFYRIIGYCFAKNRHCVFIYFTNSFVQDSFEVRLTDSGMC